MSSFSTMTSVEARQAKESIAGHEPSSGREGEGRSRCAKGCCEIRQRRVSRVDGQASGARVLMRLISRTIRQLAHRPSSDGAAGHWPQQGTRPSSSKLQHDFSGHVSKRAGGVAFWVRRVEEVRRCHRCMRSPGSRHGVAQARRKQARRQGGTLAAARSTWARPVLLAQLRRAGRQESSWLFEINYIVRSYDAAGDVARRRHLGL